MLKVPYGQTSKQILQSRGGDSDMLKFYSTTNKTTYGRKWEDFRPRSLDKMPKENSGYTSNIRVPVYYNARLDQIDNPGILPIISDNYHSETDKKYRPYKFQDGTEPIMNVNKKKESAYLNGIKLHSTINAQGDLASETHEKFKGLQVDRTIDGKVHGRGETGFTSNKTIEPITYHPEGTYSGSTPAYLTDRPTGISIMHSHYLPFDMLTGNDIPSIACRSDKGSAYTREAVNRLMELPDNGQNTNKPFEIGHFVEPVIGPKELSGETRNHLMQLDTRCQDYPNRFQSEYNYRYLNCVPQGDDRNGHTWGGVLKPQEDGYTRSTALHYN